MIKTIELDCAPGGIRPGELITGVVKGTVLEQHTEPNNPKGMFFGNWTWDYEGKVTDEEWLKAQEVTKVRIARLFHEGFIRYGSW